jgi:putative flippase GtrA
MSPLTRFLRFNLVGLLGIAVQLVALALLNRELPRHYLITSTLAVELTLLHNFAWHIRYTWPATSHRRTREAPAQLLRFHLSNGLISLLGNLTLMRLFVHSFHSPILIANAITIAFCGLANFLLAHHWVFASPRATARRSTRAFIASFVLVFLFAITASAQSPPHSLASRISHLATHGQPSEPLTSPLTMEVGDSFARPSAGHLHLTLKTVLSYFSSRLCGSSPRSHVCFQDFAN